MQAAGQPIAKPRTQRQLVRVVLERQEGLVAAVMCRAVAEGEPLQQMPDREAAPPGSSPSSVMRVLDCGVVAAHRPGERAASMARLFSVAALLQFCREANAENDSEE